MVKSREPESRDPDLWFSHTYFVGCAQIWKHSIQGLQYKDHPKRASQCCTVQQARIDIVRKYTEISQVR